MDEDLAERYQHLLQPLRDVEKNWDGNIREYLNDYLDKLKGDRERQTINEEGEEIKFNFSEAAMLLQGSLYIYSRKIDTLHAAITEMFVHGPSKGKKKKAADQLDETQEQLGSNEFTLLDEKAEMLRHQVDIRWLLEQDAKREKRPLPKQGCKRVEGQRDSLVKLPISFIPTKNTAPSAHYLRFEQNEENVYIPQSELFSFNTHALTDRKASMLSVFLNPAYVELRHLFTAAFIPYLRDEEGRRCRRIGSPYNLEVPPAIYEQLCSYDQGANRPDDSFLEANGVRPLPRPSRTIIDSLQESYCDDFGGESIAVQSEAQVLENRRPSSVEAVRESNGVELPPLVPSRGSEAAVCASIDADLGGPHDLSTNTAFSGITVQSEVAPSVEEELAFMDEYATSAHVRLRSKAAAPGEKRRLPFRRAKKQLEVRNTLVRKQMEAAGLDYERETEDISSYLAAKLFSRKISRIGSVLENFNPAIRNPHMQMLNNAFYEQERYERSVLKRREEAEQQKRLEERKKRAAERKKLRELRPSEMNARRAFRRPTDVTSESAGGKRRRRSDSPADTHLPPDDFGVAIEEEESMEDAGDRRVDDYDPVGRMVREVDEHTAVGTEEDEYVHSEVDIFPHPTGGSEFPDSLVRGDMSATFLFGEENEQTRHLSRFVSNDRQFFEFTELEKFFKRVSLESMGTDRAFIRQLQSWWNTDNDQSQEGMKKRLQTWTKHIVQQIEEDSKHKLFEIHEYGRNVLRAFGPPERAIGRVIKFKKIVRHVPRYEVSRYLLAVLILANCGNVEIVDDEETDRFNGRIANRTKIRLVSLEEKHKIFESEQALYTRS